MERPFSGDGVIRCPSVLHLPCPCLGLAGPTGRGLLPYLVPRHHSPAHFSRCWISFSEVAFCFPLQVVVTIFSLSRSMNPSSPFLPILSHLQGYLCGQLKCSSTSIRMRLCLSSLSLQGTLISHFCKILSDLIKH